jgi:hypothetical protein
LLVAVPSSEEADIKLPERLELDVPDVSSFALVCFQPDHVMAAGQEREYVFAVKIA